MEDADEKPLATSSEAPLCQECKEKVAQYQCPRCSWRSCSLPCCVAHKKRTGCNGHRDRTAYMPLNQMNDSTIGSDFFFLEDVLGTVHSGKRLLKQVGLSENGHQREKHHSKRPRMNIGQDDDEDAQVPQHPITQIAASQKSSLDTARKLAALTDCDETPENNHRGRRGPPATGPSAPMSGKWKFLSQQAALRGTQLLLMPSGMARHKENRSYYNKNQNAIFWTLEWFCYPPVEGEPKRGVVQVIESAVLWHSLQETIGELEGNASSISLLLKKLPSRANDPRYVQISRTATLTEALADMTVFEFPTIYVVYSSRLQEFPQSIQDIDEIPSVQEVESKTKEMKVETAADTIAVQEDP